MSFLGNAIKNAVVSKAGSIIRSQIGKISSLGDSPSATGSVVQNSYSKLAANPFKNKVITYPEDLGNSQQAHYVQFFINEQVNANVNFKSGLGFLSNNDVEYDDYNVGGSVSALEKGSPAQSDKSSLSVPRAETKRLQSSIALYMPASVAVAQTSKYGEVEMGAAVNAALTAYKGIKEGGGLLTSEVYEAVKQSAGEAIVEIGKSVADTFAPGAKAAIDIKRGKILSNRMEMTFEGVDRREFSFEFKFLPKTENEAIAVDEIVQMFRFYMAPSFDGGLDTSRTYIVPSTFDIHYMYNGNENKFINKISTCVCTAANVTYGGERTQFFRPTTLGEKAGSTPPVETSISLSFKELEVITQEKIAAGY